MHFPLGFVLCKIWLTDYYIYSDRDRGEIIEAPLWMSNFYVLISMLLENVTLFLRVIDSSTDCVNNVRLT